MTRNFAGRSKLAHAAAATARAGLGTCVGVVVVVLAVVLVLAAAVVAPARALAQTPATVNVTVDATTPGAALERVWPYHGYDEVNVSTTPDGQSLLHTLATAHTAPVHVRTHFLLNTGDGTYALKWGSTNAYTEDAAGNPIYSWTLMDGIMDAITGAGALPFAEIAFMPQALSTTPTPYQNSSTYALDGGCFFPPKDYTKWGALVGAWATHVNGRYPQVASSWLWELWNEPDIGYWHGTFADYAKLYDYTEAALHAALPTAPLGGPAVASATGTFLTQFLQHCATGANAATGASGARLDLISFHAKGGVAITGGHVEMNMGNQLRLHQSGFQAVAASAFKQTPIYVTEADPDGCAACPVSMTPADAYRNSPAYGAYELAMMKRSLELEASTGVRLGGLLTWAFTFPATPFFAGYRALTTNGIELPVLGAFRLLGSLAGTRLPVTSSGALALSAILTGSVRAQADIDALATLNGQQIQVLVWNYHDDLVAVPASPVHLSIKIPAGFGTRVTATHLRVDDSHGDAYTLWVAQGSPSVPTAAQLAALRQGMAPAALGAAQTIDVVGGSATLDFDLPRFAVSLLTLSPATAPADAAVGGGDAAPDVAPDAANRDGARADADGTGAGDAGAIGDGAAIGDGGGGGSAGDGATARDAANAPDGTGGAGAAGQRRSGCACAVGTARDRASLIDPGLLLFAAAASLLARARRRSRRRL
jgi:xylan 1,4-beta-xylosidase